MEVSDGKRLRVLRTSLTTYESEVEGGRVNIRTSKGREVSNPGDFVHLIYYVDKTVCNNQQVMWSGNF